MWNAFPRFGSRLWRSVIALGLVLLVWLVGSLTVAYRLTHRAHGDSWGDYHDVGFSARQDVWATVDFLEARRPGQSVVVTGTSMGAAVGSSLPVRSATACRGISWRVHIRT
jgi:alpha/beta superfamily hydrolase